MLTHLQALLLVGLRCLANPTSGLSGWALNPWWTSVGFNSRESSVGEHAVTVAVPRVGSQSAAPDLCCSVLMAEKALSSH